MVSIGEFRDVLDEARQKGDFATTELGNLRHGSRVDEQYKLDWAELSAEDLKAVWDAADAYALAVATLADKIWRSR